MRSGSECQIFANRDSKFKRGAQRGAWRSILPRERPIYLMPDPRARGIRATSKGGLEQERSSVVRRPPRARVARGQPSVTFANPRWLPGPAPSGARVSVRHRARGGDVRKEQAARLVARRVVPEHASGMQRELISLRATRATFVVRGQANYRARSNSRWRTITSGCLWFAGRVSCELPAPIAMIGQTRQIGRIRLVRRFLSTVAG